MQEPQQFRGRFRSVGSVCVWRIGQFVPDGLDVIAHQGVHLAQYLYTQVFWQFCQFLLSVHNRAWAGLINGGSGRDSKGAVRPCDAGTDAGEPRKEPGCRILFHHMMFPPQVGVRLIGEF